MELRSALSQDKKRRRIDPSTQTGGDSVGQASVSGIRGFRLKRTLHVGDASSVDSLLMRPTLLCIRRHATLPSFKHILQKATRKV